MRAWKMMAVALIGVVMMGGCSAVRMVGMDLIARNEVPVVDGGRIAKVNAEGYVDSPTVTVRVESPLGTQETLDWYRKTLVARGWVLKAENAGWTKAYGSMNGAPCYFATREREFWGKTALIKESLELRLEGRGEKAAVEVIITGDYVWDWPGKAVVLGTANLMTVPGWGMLGIVEMVHGDEVMLGLLVAPLTVPYYVLRLAL